MSNQVSVQRNQNQVQSQTRQVTFPTQSEWGQIMQIATTAFKSGLLPSSVRNVESAAIIALKAWEVGIPPMMAYSHIHVINGRPTMSAELMQALARRNLPGLVLNVIETTDKQCVIEIKRPERESIKLRYTFTIQDAERAKLLGKDVWKQYPKAMLLSRCMSGCLRAQCADALMGISYTPEELEDDSAIETTGRPVGEGLNHTKPAESAPTPTPEKSSPISQPTASQEEVDTLLNLVKASGIKIEVVKDHMKNTYHVETSKELTSEEVKELSRWVKDQIVKPEPEPSQTTEEELPPWQQEMMGDPHSIK